MISDIRFEAAFLRAGLLVGVSHERDVAAWAEERFQSAFGHESDLADVLLAPLELTAMRDALRPLADGCDEREVAASLLIALALEEPARDVRDRLRVLGAIRRETSLPPAIAGAIKALEDRAMLAKAGVSVESAVSGEELSRWLDGVRSPAYFSFSFREVDEAVTFVAAVSRKIDRDRRWGELAPDVAAQLWRIDRSADGPQVIAVNERAWRTIAREFAPIPVASRIPWRVLPESAVEVLSEGSVVAMGVDDVSSASLGRRDSHETDRST